MSEEVDKIAREVRYEARRLVESGYVGQTADTLKRDLLRVLAAKFQVKDFPVALVQDGQYIKPANLYTCLLQLGIFVDPKVLGDRQEWFDEKYGTIRYGGEPGSVLIKPIYPVEFVTVNFTVPLEDITHEEKQED
ncbi:hypothetical protein [Methylobacter sp.]|uniref:hypothetical protein n=1 Tax=Methylobacter sp. TaxID=2051955 RepID=UPI0011F95470|nr:hypothetical protein [Methylobacter sp.]TAK59516.1 MAG: hypothetical protein EPO18_20355 [Methylobacter sp.]